MKKQLEKNNLRNVKGITLIALVITIIVLLILAGVAVGMLRTDNSILKQSREAKNKTNTSQIKENVQLALYEAVSKAAVEGKENFETSDLQTAIEAYYSSTNATVEAGDPDGWTVTIIDREVKYTVPITADGKIDEENITTEDAP